MRATITFHIDAHSSLLDAPRKARDGPATPCSPRFVRSASSEAKTDADLSRPRVAKLRVGHTDVWIQPTGSASVEQLIAGRRTVACRSGDEKIIGIERIEQIERQLERADARHHNRLADSQAYALVVGLTESIASRVLAVDELPVVRIWRVVEIEVEARQPTVRLSGPGADNRANLHIVGQQPRRVHHEIVANIVVRPGVLRIQVLPVLIEDVLKLPLVRVVILAMGERVERLELQSLVVPLRPTAPASARQRSRRCTCHAQKIRLDPGGLQANRPV